MIVAISGSRYFNDYNYISVVLDKLRTIPDLKIHVGDANGVDTCVVNYCINNNIPYQKFVANWYKNGYLDKFEGPRRNAEIIKDAQLLIAFPKNTSKGTRDAIKQASKKGIAIHVIEINRN